MHGQLLTAEEIVVGLLCFLAVVGLLFLILRR